jgi:hypothetical protein
MHRGLKVLLGITVVAVIVLLLGLARLIALNDSGTSFLEGMITGCGVGIIISLLRPRGKPGGTTTA